MKNLSKILFIIFLVLIIIPFANANYKREVYDYQGSHSREKVNYSLIDSDEFTGGNMTLSGWCKGNIDWINLTNYPVACPDGTHIEQLGDSVTCSVPNALNLSNFDERLDKNRTGGNVDFEYNVSSNDSVKSNYFDSFTSSIITFFKSVLIIGDLNATGNITAEGIILDNGGTLLDNATCTFIESPDGSSVTEICDTDSFYYKKDGRVRFSISNNETKIYNDEGDVTVLFNDKTFNRTATFTGSMMNNDNIDDSSRFVERNLNNGTFAAAVFTVRNDIPYSSSFGLTSSNFLYGLIGANEAGLSSVSPGKMNFMNRYNYPFVWYINLQNDSSLDNISEIMRLNENGLNVNGSIYANHLNISNNFIVNGSNAILGDGAGPHFFIVDGGLANRNGYKIRQDGSEEWLINQPGNSQDLVFYSYDGGGDVLILESLGNAIFKYNLTTEGFAEFKGKVAKFHAHNITTPDTNWNNVTWNITIDEETTTGFRIDTTDNNESIISDINGIVRFGGCAHPIWEGSGGSNEKVSIRMQVNGVEQKCSQRSIYKSRIANEIDTMDYDGTIDVNIGDVITVQYKVSDTDMNFEGDGDFDDPISFSVNLEMISRPDG